MQRRGRLIIASIIKLLFTGLKSNMAQHKASPSGSKLRHLDVCAALRLCEVDSEQEVKEQRR